jgi:hypothetical protein
MMKLVCVAVFAAVIGMPEAAAQSLLQRSDWDRKFETYLPRVDTTVPWLGIDTKTQLPKGDIPLGRDVASIVLPSRSDLQASTNSIFTSRSM